MNVFQCLSCQHSSFPVTREMVRLKPCTLCASEVKYACQCCINHQKRWAKGQIQSHQDQWTFFSPIKSHELWIRSRRMSELCQPHWETVVQMLVCCLASHSCEVKQRLADVSFMERIWCWWAGFHSGTQRGGVLVSLHGGKAGPTLPVAAVCEGILFLQTHTEAHQQAASPAIWYCLGAALSSSSFTAQQATIGRI